MMHPLRAPILALSLAALLASPALFAAAERRATNDKRPTTSDQRQARSVDRSSTVANRARDADLARRAQAILENRFVSCHGGNGTQSGLDLRTHTGLLKGGDRGPAVVPGKPESSRLWRMVSRRDPPPMPPGPPLPAAEVATLKAWIQAGAPSPAASAPPSVSGVGDETHATPGARRPAPGTKHLTPVRRPAVPTVRNRAWVRNPIDAFVLARLEAEGLSPSPPADRRTLLRRATFALTGLPPTPEEMVAFLADSAADDAEAARLRSTTAIAERGVPAPASRAKKPDAFEKVVDRLLASPHYGERWGRHWLDLVRYAETNGYERDAVKPNAWKYRDYVIRAFNEDRPYDRFILEQLAGDELEPGTDEARIATGFYRLGLWDDEPGDILLDRYDQLDDLVRTTSTTFLGLTIQCARCHDHKFDPISQKEYYRLLAYFAAGQVGADTYPNGTHKKYDDQILLAPPAEARAHKEALAKAETAIESARKARDAHKAAVRQRIEADRRAALPEAERAALETKPEARTPEQKALAEKAQKAIHVSDADLDREQTDPERARRDELLAAIDAAHRSRPEPLPSSLGMSDVGREAPKLHLLRRGDPRDPGEEVQPGVPALFGTPPPVLPEPAPDAFTTGRRLALARWIASAENPLTARVMVNRIWQHHFGAGLVRTPSDWGAMGDRPSHPELLDWLAAEFAAGGWRLKRLHRMILLSATWQQASTWRAEPASLDPENRLLWRQNYRRLEAEPIRDAMLAASGKLNREMGGPSVYPPLPPGVMEAQKLPAEAWKTSNEVAASRRSVYVFVKRSLALPFLEVMDAADASTLCPQRNQTTVAPQALALMNNDFARAQAAHLAERVREEAGPDLLRRIARAYQLVLCRDPRPDEVRRCLRFYHDQRARIGGESADREAFVDLCQVLFNLNEFVYID